MAIVVKDRVKVTFTTTGTADFTLGSATLGFQDFSIIGNGNETYYAAVDAITGDWEVGIGTYTTSGPTLTRTTILESSAAGAKVSFSSGSKDVFVTYPAERAVYLDTAGSYPVQNTFNTLNATTATLTSGTVSTTPFSATDLVNKSYVDTIAAQGIVYHDPVYVESPSTAGNLTAIYTGGGTNSNIILIANGSDITFFGYTPVVGDQFFTSTGNGLLANTAYWIVALVGSACQVSLSFNGAIVTGLTNGGVTLPSLINPGVGAILTNNGTKAALTIDGVLMTTTKRVLIYNQTNAFENGVYTVTTVGTPDPGGTNWVLTRATDADTYGPNAAAALGQGDAFFVQAGDTGAGELYSCNTVGPIVFGVTNITFAQISATVPYFAGTGLNLSPITTFNISNVGTAGTYGSASNVPVFVTNAQGQVTSVTNTGIAITSAAVSGLAASATTDTTDAANITSGVLPSGRISGSYTGLTGTGALAAGSLATGFTAVSAPLGGTGQTSYAVGDLIYADTTTSFAKLADVAVGNALISGGVGSAPSYGKIGLATHVSGTLPVASGGTGVTSSTGTVSVVLSNSPTLVTPALGTPSALVGTNITGTAAGLSIGGNAATATTATTATNQSGGTVSATSISDSGNLTFTGTGNRITGDFSNGTVTSRVAFQSSTTNGQTGIQAIPNGTSQQALFEANSDSSGGTNGSVGQFGVVAGSEIRVISGQRGTGTYLPMTFYTGGSERVRVDTSGNVGIGTSSPAYKLDVTGQGRATTGFAVSTDGSTFTPATLNAIPNYGVGYITSTSQTALSGFGGIPFYTNQLERMRIDSSGNVGIGTSSPSARLTSYNGSNDYQLALGSANTFEWKIGRNNSDGKLYFQGLNGGSTVNNVIVADLSGNVGVGTSSPLGKLQVSGVTQSLTGGYGQLNVFSTDAIGANKGGKISFGGVSGASGFDPYGFCSIAGYKDNATSSNFSGYLQFSTSTSGGTVTERMRIDSSGNVGIGTSSPTAKLTIVDELNAGLAYSQYSNSDGTSYRNYRARGTVAAPLAVLANDRLGAFINGGYGATAGFSGLNGGFSIFAAENFSGSACGTYVTLSTTALGVNTGGGGTERVRVDAAGNVGIGTTTMSGKFNVVGGRSFHSAASEPFAVAAKYVESGGAVYFGATNGTSTPDVQISNSGGSAVLTITNAGNATFLGSSAATSGTFVNSVTVSSGNTTGNGIILADDGDIVDLNDSYCAMRFSGGVRIHSGNRTGGAVITLASSGAITATNNITAYSDERLKTDWAVLGADFVDRLALVKSGTYTRTDSGQRQAGASAQDWLKLLPEVVQEGTDEQKTLSLAYGNAAMVSAVQLAQRVVEQDARIAKLEALVAKLVQGS